MKWVKVIFDTHYVESQTVLLKKVLFRKSIDFSQLIQKKMGVFFVKSFTSTNNFCNFVNSLQNRLTKKSWFYLSCHTVWKLRKFSLTLFSQKFRQNNDFTKEITKWLVWQNFFSVRENFLFFHTVCQKYH